MSKENFKTQKMRGSADISYLGRSIDEMIWDFMREEGIDGLTMAIVQAPYIPRVVGYGFSDYKEKRLSSSNTMWPIGKISQGFIAVAIMQLYEDSKLDINDPISKYLSDIPEMWREIAIIELLRHSSGIEDYSLSNGFNPSNPGKFQDLIELVAKDHMKFPHGTDVAQSATNFLLLTEIIERITKESYCNFVTERQIKALDLKHTGFAKDLDSFKHEDVRLTENIHQHFKTDKDYIDPTEYAVSYDKDGVAISREECSNLRGFTDLWASAQDISIWDIALAGSILIHDANNRALIYGPWKLPNGHNVPAVAGWQFYSHKGLMDIKGTVKGYSSFLSRFTDPKELVCVTLMANKEGIDFSNLARRVAAAFGDLLSTNYNDNSLYIMESQFSVDEMVKRLEKELKNRDIPVFAKIDHSENAKEVNLSLRPTTVLIFGSPKVGTHMMEEDQSVSLELPLRISMWEDEKGSTWIGFKKVRKMLSEYNISNSEIIFNMEKLLEDITSKVANIY